MLKSRSISQQLSLVFGIVLVVAALTGVVGVFGARSITATIHTAAVETLPKAEKASVLAERTAELEVTLISYLDYFQVNSTTENEIAVLRSELTNYVSDYGNAEISDHFSNMDSEISSALSSHGKASQFVFDFEGMQYTLPTFIEHISVENSRYLQSVNQAARFGVFEGLLVDPSETVFARWSRDFEILDEELSALIADYAEAEADMVTYVAERIVTSPERAEAQFVRMQARRTPKVDRALDALLILSRSRFSEVRTAKIDSLDSLKSRLNGLITASREGQHSAMRDMAHSIARAEDRGTFTVIAVSSVFVIGFGIVVFVAIFSTRKIGMPLKILSNVIASLADRKFDTKVPFISRLDEIGTIARASETFRTNELAADEQRRASQAAQDQVVESLAEGLGKLSAGDLTFEIQDPFIDSYDKLRVDFNSTRHKLHSLLQSVVEHSVGISKGAKEVNSGSDDLSRRTESQAASLAQTAAALAQLTATVEQTAQTSDLADIDISKTKESAHLSSQVVEKTIDAMGAIKASSDKISTIMSLIDDIAFQTNLLALNAGVEAARAGEAGAGFAVVATEVRSLANRASDAAQEINALINESAQHVEQGVEMVGSTGSSLSEIVTMVENISGLVSEISATSKEQSHTLREINTTVTELDRVTQQNAAMAEETTAASHVLNSEASQLEQLSGQFSLENGNSPQSKARQVTAPKSSIAA